jgi:hypothetical protein
MHPRLHVRLPYLDQPNFNLLFGPLQAPCHRTQGNWLEAIDQDRPPVEPHLLQDAVLRPGSQGDVEDPGTDINKSSLSHHSLEEKSCIEIHTQRSEGLDDQTPVLRHGVVFRHGAIVTLGVMVNLLQLEPSSGL